jgi:hypothetical protein
MTSTVQYRNPDENVAPGTSLAPLGDPAGRTVVVGAAGVPISVIVVPSDLTAFGRIVYRTAKGAGPNFFYENEAVVAVVPRVVELLYVQMLGVLVNAAPLYPLVVDKAGAVVATDGGASPLSRVAAVGDLVFWEPPDGFLFTAGIRIIVSTTPNYYTAPGAPEPISVLCRTRDP